MADFYRHVRVLRTAAYVMIIITGWERQKIHDISKLVGHTFGREFFFRIGKNVLV
jgi:hypothetical protein